MCSAKRSVARLRHRLRSGVAAEGSVPTVGSRGRRCRPLTSASNRLRHAEPLAGATISSISVPRVFASRAATKRVPCATFAFPRGCSSTPIATSESAGSGVCRPCNGQAATRLPMRRVLAPGRSGSTPVRMARLLRPSSGLRSVTGTVLDSESHSSPNDYFFSQNVPHGRVYFVVRRGGDLSVRRRPQRQRRWVARVRVSGRIEDRRHPLRERPAQPRGNGRGNSLHADHGVARRRVGHGGRDGAGVAHDAAGHGARPAAPVAPVGQAPAPAPAPKTTMTASFPSIDTARIPVGSHGSAIEMLAATDEAPSASGDGTGAFRTVCDFSHMAFDDPIVYPGQPGKSHLHAFFGNTGTNANSTAASIANTGNSTCRGGTINRSGYWVPAMIDTLDGTPVAPLSLIVYYKTGYNGVGRRHQVVAAGLRMIAGDSGNSGPGTNGAVRPISPASAVSALAAARDVPRRARRAQRLGRRPVPAVLGRRQSRQARPQEPHAYPVTGRLPVDASGRRFPRSPSMCSTP